MSILLLKKIRFSLFQLNFFEIWDIYDKPFWADRLNVHPFKLKQLFPLTLEHIFFHHIGSVLVQV